MPQHTDNYELKCPEKLGSRPPKNNQPNMTATEAELIQWCRDRMASYKRPEKVFFMDELPRNPMGKVIKRDLRATYGGRADTVSQVQNPA